MEHTEFSPEHHEVAPMSGSQKILRAHRNRERGAVLVEAAIAIPLLLFVILGSLEFGVGWEAKSATTSGLRSGLLRASTLADDPQTDLRTLQSIIGEVGADKADRIQWVVIFDADPANGDLNSIVDACRDAVLGGPQESFCVGYTRQTLIDIATTSNIDVSDFDPSINSTCDTGLLDEGQFCATSRIINGDIEIGVAFEYQHSWLTGILPFGAPTFREVQTSSTFAADGADINGTNAITNPSSVAAGTDLAQLASASASGSPIGFGGDASRAIDGDTDGRYNRDSVTHSAAGINEPFLDINLGANFPIDEVVVWNRTDNCCRDRLAGFVILVSDVPFPPNVPLADLIADPNIDSVSQGPGTPGATTTVALPAGTTGQYVRIQLPGSNRTLSVAELQVLAG